MSHKLTPEQEAAIIDSYLAGASARKAGALVGVGHTTCYNVLKRNGVSLREYYISSDEEVTVVEAYRRGLSADEAGALVGVSGGTVVTVLKQHGVQVRDASECQRTYSLNHDYFVSVDTEEKAYWLGFLAADGCVTDRGCVELSLAMKDKEHVEKFRAAVGAGHPARIRQSTLGGLQYCLTFRSRRMAADLAPLGIVPRKSLVAEPWNGPADLMPHYWRGAVDGDGTICTYLNGHQRYVTWSVGLVGSEPMVSAFARFVKERIGPDNPARRRLSIYKVNYGGVIVPQAVARVLYEGATVALDRKAALARALLAVVPKRRRKILER